MICERVQRQYLGLDGGNPADADEAIVRLLGLTESLRLMGTDFAQETVRGITAVVSDELLSLRSSTKHKDAAEPLLQNLGLLGKTEDTADLLGGGCQEQTTPSAADLLGGVGESTNAAQAGQEMDLLGSVGAPTVEANQQDNVVTATAVADLLGSLVAPGGGADLLGNASASTCTGLASLDPMLSENLATAQPTGNPLAGLTIESDAPMPSVLPSGLATGEDGAVAAEDGSMAAALASPAAHGAANAASHAALDELAAEGSKKVREDAFGFVGDELVKAQTGAKSQGAPPDEC